MATLEKTANGFAVRLRFARNQRDRFQIRIKNEAEAQKRADAMERFVTSLVKVDDAELAHKILSRAGDVDTEKFEVLKKTVQGLSSGKVASRKDASLVTFGALGSDWAGGQASQEVRRPREIEAFGFRRFEPLGPP